MNTSTREKVLRRKRRIKRRNRLRKFKARAKPMMAARNIQYDMSDRTRAIGCGGIGSIHLLARKVGLIDAIDRDVDLLKVHLPYHESDHVLNLAYNVLCGGDCLQDLELLRNDEAYLDGLGAQRIPDPTTAGDFCRRFRSAEQVNTLQETINGVRAGVWKRQPPEFFERAVIDADGTLAPTLGECKAGKGRTPGRGVLIPYMWRPLPQKGVFLSEVVRAYNVKCVEGGQSEGACKRFGAPVYCVCDMIYYGTPYSTEKRIGRAYNQFMALLPDRTDFGCLVDADAVFTVADYGHQIERIIDENPPCRLFYARTNRISCPWQLDDQILGDDMRRHRDYGKSLAELHGSAVREVQQEAVPGSGFLILLRKDLWAEVPFKEDGMLNVDWDFYCRVVASGERVLLMQGIYLYHWYRGGNTADTSHLR